MSEFPEQHDDAYPDPNDYMPRPRDVPPGLAYFAVQSLQGGYAADGSTNNGQETGQADDLEALFNDSDIDGGVADGTQLEYYRVETSAGVHRMLDLAMGALGNSITTKRDTTPKGRTCLSWTSSDDLIEVRATARHGTEPNPDAIVIHGSTEWLAGLQDKGLLSTGADIEVVTTRDASDVLFLDGSAHFKIVTRAMYLVPNMTDKDGVIEFVGMKPEYVISDGSHYDNAYPTILAGAGINLDADPAIQFAAMDAYLAREAAQQMTAEIHIDELRVESRRVEAAAVMEEAMGRRDLRTEAVIAAFSRLQSEVGAENPDAIASSKEGGVDEQLRQLSLEVTRDALALLRSAYFAGDENKYPEVPDAIVKLARMAEQDGNFAALKEYIGILELMSPPNPEAMVRVCFFASNTLPGTVEDFDTITEASQTIGKLLKAEWQAVVDKRRGDSSYVYVPSDKEDDLRVTNAIIQEYAAAGLSLPEDIIDAYTVSSDISGNVDGEARWLLQVNYFGYLKQNENSNSPPALCPDLDELFAHLLEGAEHGLQRLDFISAVVPKILPLVDNVETRDALVKLFLDVTELQPLDETTFERLLQIGNSILLNKRLALGPEGTPGLQVGKKMAEAISAIQSNTPGHDQADMRSKLVSYQAAAMIQNHIPADVVTQYINKERDAHLQLAEEKAKEIRGNSNKFMKVARKVAEKASDAALAAAASQSVSEGLFGYSAMLLDRISGERLSAYVDCWSETQNAAQVRALQPAELRFDEDVWEKIDKGPGVSARSIERQNISNLYDNALAMVSNDVDLLAARAELITNFYNAGFIRTPQMQYNMAPSLFDRLSVRQFDLILSRITEIDVDAAQAVAMRLIPMMQSRSASAYRRVRSAYPALEAGNQLDGLKMVRSYINNSSSSGGVRRVGQLADYALALRRRAA
jgi:hypothetical protein